MPISFPRWSNLRRWLKSDGKYPDGDHAYIFDNVEDRLHLQHKMGFDLTHFMNHEPNHIRTALMMYLCHRIEQSLNGQLVRLYFEGWQNLMDPYWKNKFQRWLPTLRKKNAFIVITTQSPSTVILSPDRAMMLDNVATQLFFANPQATREDYIDGFKLSESEFGAIANHAPESRLFLVKQEHDSSLCRLNLGHLPDALAVLSGNTATVLLLDQIRKKWEMIRKTGCPFSMSVERNYENDSKISYFFAVWIGTVFIRQYRHVTRYGCGRLCAHGAGIIAIGKNTRFYKTPIKTHGSN